MNKKVISLLVLAWCFSITFAQNFSDSQKDPTGLKYKFIVKNDKGAQPKIGDMVTVVAYYKTLHSGSLDTQSPKDTIFFDSRKSPTPYVFPLMESTYPGDIYQGLRMMRVGDSANFIISADSLFLSTFRVKKLPAYVKPGSFVGFFVKMTKIQPKEEFQKEMQAKFEAESKMTAKQSAIDDSILAAYVKKNNYNVKPGKSGLYYIETKEGTGPLPETGKTMKVQYTGKLLDGTVFDSSVGRAEPFSFPLGKNRVIRGWDEGIAKMKKGGKAILLIPSRLGYGGGSMGKIPANSILIFEVELIDIQ